MWLVAMGEIEVPSPARGEHHGMVDRERVLGRESSEKKWTKEKGKIRNSWKSMHVCHRGVTSRGEQDGKLL